VKRIKGRKRESVPAIRTWGDPILKMECQPVEAAENVQPIIRGMIQALKKSKNGVGLAAPQIGIAKRIIVVAANGFPKAMINPVIDYYSGGAVVAKEGCLSYPGVFKNISRSRDVEITFEDIHGVSHKEVLFAGTEARIIQHECDHLDGICRVGGGK